MGLHGQIDDPRRRTRALEHVGDEVSFFALRVYRRQDGDDRLIMLTRCQLAFHLGSSMKAGHTVLAT